MKTTNQIMAVLALLLFLNFNLNAQEDRYQLYVVHEDRVKDGMIEKHMEADKALLKAAKQNEMKDFSWISFQSDDNRMLYLSPIENFAELDHNPFKDLEDKIGEEEMDKLLEAFSNTYSEHGDYVLILDKELSYMPEGITQTPQGEDYRQLDFYHIPPGKDDKAEELARSVKDLYSKKGSKLNYRLYKSSFGVMGNYYMVAMSAKSADELAKLRNENDNLVGDEGKKLMEEIQKTVSKIETLTGKIRPDLSYMNN
ncbi:hypothetical protein [Christiangramia salexigens]|uniref:Uncharacterized protein n=1 Tax=Christiangramia salexigens TaxID=1913577 RepID=A0A1L3J3T9_9FLAO|nr:hypothetical protein [Christiangramia salexigens]APG59799.1 hypothetical protein LPB144_04930 [Christiangramia salexigens]